MSENLAPSGFSLSVTLLWLLSACNISCLLLLLLLCSLFCVFKSVHFKHAYFCRSISLGIIKLLLLLVIYYLVTKLLFKVENGVFFVKISSRSNSFSLVRFLWGKGASTRGMSVSRSPRPPYNYALALTRTSLRRSRNRFPEEMCILIGLLSTQLVLIKISQVVLVCCH